jgi:hypothetical protein
MVAHIPLGSGADEVLLESLTKLGTSLASGKLPDDVRDLFCAARLIALPKKPTGVRPIAVGETFRRLAAKCLVDKYQVDAVASLAPLQVGVGIPGTQGSRMGS